MTGNPQWWFEFERGESLRMERLENARAAIADWRARILEWDNMIGGLSTVTEPEEEPL